MIPLPSASLDRLRNLIVLRNDTIDFFKQIVKFFQLPIVVLVEILELFLVFFLEGGLKLGECVFSRCITWRSTLLKIVQPSVSTRIENGAAYGSQMF